MQEFLDFFEQCNHNPMYEKVGKSNFYFNIPYIIKDVNLLPKVTDRKLSKFKPTNIIIFWYARGFDGKLVLHYTCVDEDNYYKNLGLNPVFEKFDKLKDLEKTVIKFLKKNYKGVSQKTIEKLKEFEKIEIKREKRHLSILESFTAEPTTSLSNFKKDIEILLSLYDFKLKACYNEINEYKKTSYQDLINDLKFEITFLLWRKYYKNLNMVYFDTLRTLSFVNVAWDDISSSSEHHFTLDINYDILFKEEEV
jgi:hypothetical protein